MAEEGALELSQTSGLIYNKAHFSLYGPSGGPQMDVLYYSFSSYLSWHEAVWVRKACRLLGKTCKGREEFGQQSS